jgi:hypothetical protein
LLLRGHQQNSTIFGFLGQLLLVQLAPCGSCTPSWPIHLMIGEPERQPEGVNIDYIIAGMAECYV